MKFVWSHGLYYEICLNNQKFIIWIFDEKCFWYTSEIIDVKSVINLRFLLYIFIRSIYWHMFHGMHIWFDIQKLLWLRDLKQSQNKNYFVASVDCYSVCLVVKVITYSYYINYETYSIEKQIDIWTKHEKKTNKLSIRNSNYIQTFAILIHLIIFCLFKSQMRR